MYNCKWAHINETHENGGNALGLEMRHEDC